jgi:DNA-binding MarR family transcriptional regulator
MHQPDPRDVSRRRGPRRRTYLPERLGNDEHFRVKAQPRPPEVVLLGNVGAMTSVFRARLKFAGIDPRLARCILVFESDRLLRVSDIAWRCGVSLSTASRWLDRAEAERLVDKVYLDWDRRGTWGRTTRAGREFQQRVATMLCEITDGVRPAGTVYGARYYRPYFSRNE